jgi:Transcriptional regulators
MASETAIDALAESALATDVDFLAVKAFATGTRIANRSLARLDLRVRSYSVLAITCGARPVTQRDLAEFLSLDPSQIVALVDELESDGLVRREVDPTDRRSRVVRATDRGQERFAEAREAIGEAQEEALAALDVEERDVLLTLLRKLVFGDRAVEPTASSFS